MSYTKRYSRTVSKTVTKSVSYSYPASQNGGSGSVTATMVAEIPVDIDITVDTSHFDHSVQNCNTNIDILTGAVVATEAAEIVSKKQNSKKVANAIIGGFFGYIRSELSQQVAELAQNIDAQLLHLKELASSCLAKKKQMETDYNRIASRYLKIFVDLDNELTNRIYELDRPTFEFMKETDGQKLRRAEGDLVNTVAIFGTDNSNLHSKISISFAKKRALDTINQAKVFLWEQKKMNATIQQSMLNKGEIGPIYAYVCFTETNNADNISDNNVYYSKNISVRNENNPDKELVELFSSEAVAWDNIIQEKKDKISMYFNTEINNNLPDNDSHSIRVRDMIQKMVDFSAMSTINF